MTSLRTAAPLLASLFIASACGGTPEPAPASPPAANAPAATPPSTPPPAGADAAAAQVINLLMNALAEPDPDRAAQAVMPYVHSELMNGDKSGLSNDVRQFSFKKAHSNARFYKVPVEITRAREPSNRPLSEPGRTIDYFIAKRPGVDGMPAPIPVFFPANGGPAKIAYLGNL